MKNAFYITLKALFVLKVLKFLSGLFGHVEKRLEYSQTFFWEKTVCLYFLRSSALSKYTETKLKPLVFSSYKAFLKIKKVKVLAVSGTPPPPGIGVGFPSTLLTDQISLVAFTS